MIQVNCVRGIIGQPTKVTDRGCYRNSSIAPDRGVCDERLEERRDGNADADTRTDCDTDTNASAPGRARYRRRDGNADRNAGSDCDTDARPDAHSGPPADHGRPDVRQHLAIV
jgi:hypothetical protein